MVNSEQQAAAAVRDRLFELLPLDVNHSKHLGHIEKSPMGYNDIIIRDTPRNRGGAIGYFVKAVLHRREESYEQAKRSTEIGRLAVGGWPRPDRDKVPKLTIADNVYNPVKPFDNDIETRRKTSATYLINAAEYERSSSETGLHFSIVEFGNSGRLSMHLNPHLIGQAPYDYEGVDMFLSNNGFSHLNRITDPLTLLNFCITNAQQSE